VHELNYKPDKTNRYFSTFALSFRICSIFGSIILRWIKFWPSYAMRIEIQLVFIDNFFWWFVYFYNLVLTTKTHTHFQPYAICNSIFIIHIREIILSYNSVFLIKNFFEFCLIYISCFVRNNCLNKEKCF